ncbi:peptidoglycan editing factor PgeF [Bacillus alkalicola]|uniref:Purine nucleoside phosphorylase n=1 Tax=Evansella alkalicola TaxID=745819 RepID=A0ABS6JS78_9BACI|nr:peptidoglycan editing factor PgeF [Bacillus alkalicola]MBU9721414.1 peptidoglycan editing factor PgeF [Bacillus alkalicola]
MFIKSWNKKDPSIVAGMTTKNGGFSTDTFSSFNLGLHVNDNQQNVIKNREKLASLLSFPTSNWACGEQVHDNKIMEITKAHTGMGVYDYKESLKGVDGFYTKDPNILLTTCYADCVPLFFMEPKRNLLGIAHAGWKGTVKNIGGEMIRVWVEKEGVALEDIYAVIGPSIGGCCYVVDDYVIDFVREVSPSPNVVYSEVEKGQYSLNLKELNKQLLQQAGLVSEKIEVTKYCTSCDHSIFFSHRRDNGNTGRMLSFIGRKEG